MGERQFEVHLQTLKCDNGGEYVSREMKSFRTARGIASRPTLPHSPHQNGAMERLHRTLCDVFQSKLGHRKFPKIFWAKALSVAAFVRNRVISRGIPPTTTTFETFFSHKTDLSHLRVFRSCC